MNGDDGAHKLIVQTRVSEEKVYQDTFYVNTWEDVDIIHIKPIPGVNISQEQVTTMVEEMQENWPKISDRKPVVLFGEFMDISMYYIEEEPKELEPSGEEVLEQLELNFENYDG